MIYQKGNPLFSLSDPSAVLNPFTAADEAIGGAVVGGILSGGQIAAGNVDAFLEGFLDGDVEPVRTKRGIDAKRPYQGEIPALPQRGALAALPDGGGLALEGTGGLQGTGGLPGAVDLRKLYEVALQNGVALPEIAREWYVEQQMSALRQEFFRRVYGVEPIVPRLPEWSGGGLEGSADAGGGALVPMFQDSGEASPEVEDQREFAEFQAVLGDDAPKSLAEFLDLKYNRPDSWIYLKTKKEQTIFVEKAPCVTTPKKYVEFFLKPGAKHADQFFAVGYTVEDSLRLRYDMARQFDMRRAVNYKPVAGKKGVFTFNIYMMLGINSKKRFRTCWQIDVGTEKPRIITAFRDDKE